MRGLLTSSIVAACAALVAATLAGCKVGPDYHRPAAFVTNAVPEAFSENTAVTNLPDWKPAAPAASLPRGAWWEVFGDPELDRLEALASAQNQEIATAVERLAQAREAVNLNRADLFPQVDVGASYTRQRTSNNQPQSGHAAGASTTFNTFSLPLQAGWELDLWGRVRRQVDSARARMTATADDLESIRLVVQAEVAADYLSLRALDAEEALLRRTVETFSQSLELTLNRRRGGIASDLDVAQAETQVRTAEAALPALRLERTRLLHALASLCGQPATGFYVLPEPALKPAVPVIPVSLPSELLERRPDIAAAERRMASANAQIGVAHAAFYPRVRINGLAGFQSVDASSWFDWPSRMWAFGPSVDLPIFTGGRNRAQLAFSKAVFRETVGTYRQTVLTAFQEVEDQLAAQRLLQEQLRSQELALAAAQRTLDIANNRYKAGLVTFLEVAISQSAALNLERTAVQLRGQISVAAVGLIRALGGGWEAPGRQQP